MEEIDVLNFIHDSLHSTAFDILSYVFEYVFKTEIVWIIISLILIKYPRTRAVGGILFLSIMFETFSVYLIKIVTDMPRPYEIYDVDALFTEFHWGSFPSSHAALACVLATVFSAFYKKATIPLFALAALVGITRLYSYSHFPFDVIFGSYLGIICSLMALFIIYRAWWWTVYVEDESQDENTVQ